jgi:hypothetical protein
MTNAQNKFSAVTTFHLPKHLYAVEMINSFFANWPNEVTLTAFIENSSKIDDSAVKPKIIIKDFEKNIPKYQNFVEKFKEKEKYTDDFRFNVFRFAHKVYAIEAALKNAKSKYLIWLDADIKTYKRITLEFLETLVKPGSYMSYLGRENISVKHLNYSECGFLIFDTQHALHKNFWHNMMKMYDGGKLFQESEWHDSYIFDIVRKNLENEKNLKNFDITSLGLVKLNNDNHVFISSVLGKFMDHKKGNRKLSKWSHELLYRIKKEKENNS